MIAKAYSSRKAFTLVEIMIVVAIIALLAAIAVPGFLRARKRSQVTKILNEARVMNDTVEIWMTETNKIAPLANLYANDIADAGYFKVGSRFAAKNFVDTFGRPYLDQDFDGRVRVNPLTIADLTDVVPADFWSGYDED